jgi:hypothetical protein
MIHICEFRRSLAALVHWFLRDLWYFSASFAVKSLKDFNRGVRGELPRRWQRKRYRYATLIYSESRWQI